MDIGPMPTNHFSTIKTTKGPGSTVSASGGSRPVVVSASHVGFTSPGKGPGSTVSNGGSHYTHHHSNSSSGNNSVLNGSSGAPTPPRAVRLRSTNSVVSTASYSSRAGTGASETRDSGSSVHTVVVGAGATVYHPSLSGNRSTGSVTSDEGTVSEDSDLVRGGDVSSSPPQNNNHNPRSLYAMNGRQSSYSSSTSPAGAGPPKVTTTARARTLTASNIKPVRMAAGASIKADGASLQPSLTNHTTGPSIVTDPNGGSGPTGSMAGHAASWSTGSTVGVGGRNHSNPGYLTVSRSVVNGASAGDDTGSMVSMVSSVSTTAHAPSQGMMQSSNSNAMRGSKAANSTIAANNKAAEESRQAEAARTQRKIADLKISNDSLLQINASLEALVRKQVSEINELKLRVAQLGDSYSPADLALMRSVDAIELTEEERQGDTIFKRLCFTIESMVNEAQQALDSTKPAGVKVLSSYDMYIKELGSEIASDEEEGDDTRSNPSDSDNDSDGEGGKHGLSELSGSSTTRLDSSYSSSSSKRNSSSSLSNTSSLGKTHLKDDEPDHNVRRSVEAVRAAAPSPSNATFLGDRSSFVEEAIAA
ncbi:hypothetical protein BGZ73_005574 [Actinomortierella ambigua]|nr:hypothetical protein BGZ73_005574 [Actinomortierella ambigua]